MSIVHHKRKLAALLAAVMMFSLLTGCGAGKEAKPDQPDEKTASVSKDEKNGESKEAKESKEEKEPVGLTVFVPGTNETDFEVYTEIAKQVQEADPNVTVEIIQIPWGEYFTKLNVAFSGGTAPDVFGVGLGQIGPVQNAGNMLALDPYLDGWDGWDDIPQNVLDVASRDGKLYGDPMIEVRPLYYRKDMFQEAGLTEPPKTIDELHDFAEKLTKTENGRVKISGLDIGTGEQTLFAAMLMFGADRLWNDDLTSAMMDGKAQEALTWCQNIMLEGISDHTIMHDVQGDLFENGLAAMCFGGSNGYLHICDKLGKENVGVAPLPTQNYMVGTTCWAVYAQSKHIEEAVELWKAFASKEGQMKIAEKIGFVPTRTSLKEDYIALNPEVNSVFFNSASHAAPYGVLNPYFFEFVNNIRPLIDEVYYGEKEPAEAMTEFAQKYDEAVKEAKGN